MNKSDRLRLLIERGYFPEEMPPPFHTSDLARFRRSILRSWAALGNYPNSAFENYSVPRISRLRRNLAIVNPVAQTFLSQLVADNWVQIRGHLRKSLYSIEVPEIEEDKDRAVAPPDFGLIALKRIEIAAGYDHALLSDLSRFYGTLYTHVIPWALHGKTWCKQHLNTPPYNATLGARLDVAVRRGQENQTIGIPIGPDTSRILSEIVVVDLQVQQTLNLNRNRAFRNIDDWYIGFDNAGEAENAIATLAIGCRDYELELNAEKTRTLDALSAIEALWPTELRETTILRDRRAQQRSIEHYFAKAFDFARQHPSQNVLDYAVKRTRVSRILRENWRLYENFLLKSVRANATVLPAVAQIFVSYNYDRYNLDKAKIGKLIEDLIRKNAPLAYHAEVAWALFLAKALRISISSRAAHAVSQLENSVCALVALDLRKSGLISRGLDPGMWRLSMNAEGLRSHMWLLAYEADLKGWLAGAQPDFVDTHPYFSVLKARNISFYDIRRNIKHIRRERPRPRSTAFLEFIRSIRTTLPLDISAAGFAGYT